LQHLGYASSGLGLGATSLWPEHRELVTHL